MLYMAVRPGKLDTTSGYCLISVSTSLRCSDFNVSEILTSRYDSGFFSVGKFQSSSENASLLSSSTDSINNGTAHFNAQHTVSTYLHDMY